MIVPPVSHARWRDVASGRIHREWSLLATKILVTRIQRAVAQDQSPATLDRFVGEIHTFFVKNAQLAKADLVAIFA